jgi:ketosteroid isomerase-like protein
VEKIDPRTVVEGYLQAFEARDLPRCIEFYDDDASLTFGPGLFQGKQAIEQWHKDRFAADMRILELEDIEVHGETVIARGLVASKRLRMLKIRSLGGTATFLVQQGKIKELQFEGRIGASSQIEERRM